MIDPGLFICGVAGLLPTERLRKLGVRAVLNAAQADLYSTGFFGMFTENLEDLPKQFDVRIIGAQDAETCNLSAHFAEIADFMEAGRKKGGVVVHCAAGISRASTSACAYLMIKERWTLNAAIKRIHSVRCFVSPNTGFWRQLRDLEASLLAQGLELNELPEDWAPCPQPLEADSAEDAARMPWFMQMGPVNTEDLIAELDNMALRCESFATTHLVAVLEPAAGTSAEELAEAVKSSGIGGARLDDVALGGGRVSIRAGLVPSLSPDGFKDILEKFPGVQGAVVEGASER